MKPNEKKMIAVLAIIVVIAIVGMSIARNNRKKQVEKDGNISTLIQGEHTQILDDGTRLNVSEKISETKKFGSFEVSGMQLTENGNVSKVIATIKNISNAPTKNDNALKITFLDKNGKVIKSVNAMIGALQPGQTAQLNTSATFDYVNAYDYKIEEDVK